MLRHMITWLEGCVTSLVPISLLEEEILFLIRHMTSRDHMIRWPCNSMSGFPSSIGEVKSVHVLRQFQLKIHNTYNDLRHVSLIHQNLLKFH